MMISVWLPVRQSSEKVQATGVSPTALANVSSEETLVISFIGYQTQEVPVNN